jgi:LPXTG-site transpeptidase (sortase) family protein
MKPQKYKPRGRPNAAIPKLTKPICLSIGGVLVFAAATALYVKFFPAPKSEARYELETSGGEIDFNTPEIKLHRLADGVAVIGTPKRDAVIAPVPVLSAPHPSAVVSDPGESAKLPEAPAAIPPEEAAPTHSGFTMPVPMDDESIGVLTIPDIDLSVRVYESDNEMESMEKGAAHFKSTSAWMGNVGLSAHNIALDGSPGYFLNLYKLPPGAVIQYETALGSRTYAIESVTEISETDWSMLGRTEDNRLTLITWISGKPSLRLCVQGLERQG